MLIGVPKEIKDNEFRVGMTPSSVREAVAHGHSVIVGRNAGAGIGCSDAAYEATGAAVGATAEEVFAEADMIVKVKEPQAGERKHLRPGQILFTYLHLAPDPEQTRDLVESGAICIAYETVTDAGGGLPLLAPMSQVAGRMSIQAGAHCLERENGGKGILLGGVPGVAPAKVVVIGGGVVGENAIYMALGMAAQVTVLDRDIDVLRHLTMRFGPGLTTVYSTTGTLDDHVLPADLVIGGVLVPGAVPRTSTLALNNVTLPYILALADEGYRNVLTESGYFRTGLNVCEGKVTFKAVAEDLGYDYVDPLKALGG